MVESYISLILLLKQHQILKRWNTLRQPFPKPVFKGYFKNQLSKIFKPALRWQQTKNKAGFLLYSKQIVMLYTHNQNYKKIPNKWKQRPSLRTISIYCMFRNWNAHNSRANDTVFQQTLSQNRNEWNQVSKWTCTEVKRLLLTRQHNQLFRLVLAWDRQNNIGI